MSVESVFADHKRRQHVNQPPPLSGIARVSTIKVTGVTVSNSMSVAQHVQKVIMSCAQTVHALRTMRAHGVTNSTLQMFYHSVALAELVSATSACKVKVKKANLCSAL